MFEDLLSLNGLSMDRLRNFCLIVTHGSLTRAAKGDPGRMALFSRQLKELETFFGVELRRRSGKGIVITEAGRKLAVLAREQFVGLEEFRRVCQHQPVDLTIASGNSIIEWMLLPRIAQLRERLPEVRIHLLGQRTHDVVAGLNEHTVDFGVVRADAVTAGLRTRKVPAVSYALFLPSQLARGITPENLRQRIARLPIATSFGSQFRQRLEQEAAKAGWPLKIELSCSSFTQAARAVEAGAYGAVLPKSAAAQLDKTKVHCLDLPFMKSYVRPLVLAWHPRMEAVRAVMKEARGCLEEILHRSEKGVE